MSFHFPASFHSLYCVVQVNLENALSEKKRTPEMFTLPLSFSVCSLLPLRQTARLSGSVMTCCHRSLWGSQECWCFRLALKGVEWILPLLPLLVPKAPFTAHIRIDGLSIFLFLSYFSISILLCLINIIQWWKTVCFPSRPATGTTSVKAICCFT